MNYSADTAEDVGGGELLHSDEESEDGDDFSEGTVVSGTQLTAYDNIMFDNHCHNAAGHVPVANTSGVPPRHERIIRKTMLDDWGITSPHTFQMQAINITAFRPGPHLYIIAKTGSGKSAIPLTTISSGLPSPSSRSL
jgi:hypothetical protein